jgi:flavodoxin
MAQEPYFDQELARQTAEAQVEAIADIIDGVDMSIIEAEQDADDHSDEWSEEYGKICEAVAGPNSPHIPDEILPFWEQNDERLQGFYRNVISEWYGDNNMGKKLLLAFNTIDKEGI